MDDYQMVQELRGWAYSDSPDEEYPDVDRDTDLYVQALLRQHDKQVLKFETLVQGLLPGGGDPIVGPNQS